MMQIVVPQGCRPGQLLQVQTPTGQMVQVAIPGGLKPGMAFTIEPMICEGTNKHLEWRDGWTATTKDGKRSAQFEHTLLITPTGVEALTAKLPTSPKYFWEE